MWLNALTAPSTRQRVYEGARELNYQPNRAARTLATGLTYTAMYIAPTPSRPFHTQSAMVLQ